mmetsp:Transcript_22117/g.25594  ORF Transcript_22117/g.25594 Transcript_22117/m.25594 type:complete len:365 (+) Transcript_22117:99-1193(+)
MQEIKEVKRLTIINIVDNETDFLSSPCQCCKPIPNLSSKKVKDTRPCIYTQESATVLRQHKSLDFNKICTPAHGLSLLLIVEYDDDDVQKEDGNSQTKTSCSHLLFDAGLDPNVWRQNAEKLNVDLKMIDRIVLSHYHIDHSNGLRSAVKDISDARSNHALSGLTVDMHTSKIVSRGLKTHGKIYPMKPDNPTVEEIENLGGTVELHEDAHLVSNDCFYVSGYIPRQTSFEGGIPGHFNALPNGKGWVPDEEIKDERYIAVKIKGRGIVVFSACSHAGIVNVCKDAVQKFESDKLTAVIGGFHLAGSSVEGRIDDTISGLKELKPDILLAGHCTGWRAKAKLMDNFEYNFQPMSVGGKYVFNSL